MAFFPALSPSKSLIDDLTTPEPAATPLALDFPRPFDIEFPALPNLYGANEFDKPVTTAAKERRAHSVRYSPYASPASSTLSPPPSYEASILQPDTAGGPVRRARSSSSKIPRPPNAFMIFKAHEMDKIKVLGVKGGRSICSVAGTMWRALDDEGKAPWIDAAERAKAAHAAAYPDYRFRPAQGVVRRKRNVRPKTEYEREIEGGVARLLVEFPGVDGEEVRIGKVRELERELCERGVRGAPSRRTSTSVTASGAVFDVRGAEVPAYSPPNFVQDSTYLTASAAFTDNTPYTTPDPLYFPQPTWPTESVLFQAVDDGSPAFSSSSEEYNTPQAVSPAQYTFPLDENVYFPPGLGGYIARAVAVDDMSSITPISAPRAFEPQYASTSTAADVNIWPSLHVPDFASSPSPAEQTELFLSTLPAASDFSIQAPKPTYTWSYECDPVEYAVGASACAHAPLLMPSTATYVRQQQQQQLGYGMYSWEQSFASSF